jgi:hypothetical protein
MENVWLAVAVMLGFIFITAVICISVCIYRYMEIKHNNGEKRPPCPINYDEYM